MSGLAEVRVGQRPGWLVQGSHPGAVEGAGRVGLNSALSKISARKSVADMTLWSPPHPGGLLRAPPYAGDHPLRRFVPSLRALGAPTDPWGRYGAPFTGCYDRWDQAISSFGIGTMVAKTRAVCVVFSPSRQKTSASTMDRRLPGLMTVALH